MAKRAPRSLLTAGLAVAVWTALAGCATKALNEAAERQAQYQRAAQRERDEAAAFARIADFRERAHLARLEAEAYQRQAAAAAEAAQRRRIALDEAKDGARAAEVAKSEAARHVARYGDAALEALRAASAYGEAPKASERDRAEQAYEAAAARLAAFGKAREGVAAAERAIDDLRRRLAVARRAEEEARRLLTGRAAEKILAASTDLASHAGALDGAGRLPASLRAALADFESTAQVADTRSRALARALVVPAKLGAALANLEDVEEATKSRLDTNLEAELRVMTEVEAETFARALRAANQARCPAGSACRAGLERELSATTGAMIVALRAARVAQRLAAETVFETSDAATRLDEAARAAETDDEAARQAAQEAVAVGASGSRLFDAATAALRAARDAYAEAMRGADAAHLAAFGTARDSSGPPPITEPVVSVAASRRETPTEPTARPVPDPDRAYELVTLKRPVPRGYGAYTYVLFPLHVGGDLTREARERYQALLAAIAQTTTATAGGPSRSRSNLFCIPTIRGGTDMPLDLAGYDSSKAKAILATAGGGYLQRPEVLRRLGYTPGPFLLTTPAPIEALDPLAPALFVDLSGYQPRQYAQIVAAYKTTVAQARSRQDVADPPVHVTPATETTRNAFAVQPVVNEVRSFLSSSAPQGGAGRGRRR